MKITYLIGAGASAKSLPVVSQIPDGLKKFAERLNQVNDLNSNRLRDEILNLSKTLSAHISIDTYAKKLFLTRKNNELKKLKYIFSIYFIYLNITRPTDNRYDLFFATILKDRPVDLPSNFRIVSWNYDFQMEKALGEYSLSNNVFDNQLYLNVYPSANYSNKTDCFTVYKLNGTTIFKDMFNQKIISPAYTFDKNEGLLLKELVEFYAKSIDSPTNEPLMRFAWEDDPVSNDIVQKASIDIADTQILLVIGYSFPQFNREVDKKVFSKLYNLTHAYFQAPANEVNYYRDRFESIYPKLKSAIVRSNSDLNSFVFPYEI